VIEHSPAVHIRLPPCRLRVPRPRSGPQRSRRAPGCCRTLVARRSQPSSLCSR
jgi:hypothetical protein